MIKTTIVGYGKVNTKMFENYMDKLEHYLPLYYPNIYFFIPMYNIIICLVTVF